MTDRNRDRYDTQKDAEEKIRRRTLRFEAHFVKIATRVGAPIFAYNKEEKPDENLPARPLRD